MLKRVEDVLKQERESSELSRLEEAFFLEVQQHIITLKSLTDPISQSNKALLEEAVKELIDLRAEKIMKGCRTGMVPQEFKLAEYASTFQKFKKDVLESLLQKEPTTQRVMVLEDLPQFYGPELEILGPYKKGDIILLEKSVAILLKEKGLVEEK